MSDYDVRFRRIGGTYYIDAPMFHASTKSRAMAFLVLEAFTQELTTTQGQPPSSDDQRERNTAIQSHSGSPTQGSHPEERPTEERGKESDE